MEESVVVAAIGALLTGLIAISSMVTALAAFCGLLIAWRQIGVSRQVAAQNAYEAYHHVVIASPQLGRGTFDFSRAKGDDRERYRWFVLSMLLTVERILTLFPKDKQWAVALEQDIILHHRFIESEWFEPHWDSLDPKVVKFIHGVLARIKSGKMDHRLSQLGVSHVNRQV